MPRPARGNNFMLFLLVFSTVSSFAAGFMIHFGTAFLQWTMPSLPVISILFETGGLFVPCLLYMAVTRESFRDVLPMRPLSFVNAAFIILMSICIQPLAMLLGEFSAFFFGTGVQQTIMEMYDQPFLMIVLAVCVTPAIIEEIVMRGIVFSNYRNVGLKKAALINGLFFGIMHVSGQQFLYAFLLGFIFVYFVYYTKSILASVLAHFCFNFTSTALSYTFYQAAVQNGETVEDIFKEPTMQEWLIALQNLAIFSAISTAVFLILFFTFIRHNKQVNTFEAMRVSFDEAALESDSEFQNQAETLEIPASDELPSHDTRIFTWGFWVLIAAYFAILAFLSGIT